MQSIILSKDDIAALVPHTGSMCLIDAVVNWDSESISCVSANHRLSSHPLRFAGRLPAVAGIEYAAQAMALHGALAAEEGVRGKRPGVLAGLREINLRVLRLDDIEDDLLIGARRLIQQQYNLLYSFRVAANEKLLLQGRAAIVLNAQTST